MAAASRGIPVAATISAAVESIGKLPDAAAPTFATPAAMSSADAPSTNDPAA